MRPFAQETPSKDVRKRSARLASVLILFGLANMSQAQNSLFEFYGLNSQDRLGSDADSIGDLDGDNIPDIIAVAPGFDGPIRGAGQAVVIAGGTGQVLFRYNGDQRYEGTLNRVSGVGDFDADGVPDFAVAVPYDIDTGSRFVGSVSVYSGRDGTLIQRFTGADDLVTRFGAVVRGAGDVNNDGFADIIVGVPNGLDPTFTTTGNAVVYSGRDFSRLFTMFGDSEADQFGTSVDGAGDIDGDGYDDVLVGAPQHDTIGPIFGSPGYVRVFSGRDGSVLHEMYGDDIGDAFGWSVAGVGDIDGDAVPELLIGEPNDKSTEPEGVAHLYSGAKGALVRTLRAPAISLTDIRAFGTRVDGLGDFNDDGVADVSVASPLTIVRDQFISSSHVFCGASGRILYTFYGSYQGSTNAVRPAGDF